MADLVKQVKKKRQREGLSIRGLSREVGVAFATIARLERGEGSPDEGTKVRLQRWLETGEGSAARDRRQTPQRVSWSAQMEQRVAGLEEQVGVLREAIRGREAVCDLSGADVGDEGTARDPGVPTLQGRREVGDGPDAGGASGSARHAERGA